MSEASSEFTSTPTGDISQLAEHLFRHESGKLVSILTGIFGIDRLQLAEDVVQEALIRAFKTWPYYGIPKNPAAWLTQTAKNLAVDIIRREQSFSEKQPQIISFIEQWSNECNVDDSPSFESEIKDTRLRLMFACCHPQVPADAQTALALKTLCGFSPEEIASAFLTTDAAIAKRLTRARQRIQELRIPFEIPAGEELTPRLDAVLQTIYLLFNEGYKASSGDSLIRHDLCTEAVRLVTALADHPIGNQPRTHALAALMMMNAARLPARVDNDGNVLRLKEQDRSKWDKGLIARGVYHLYRSAEGNEATEYHIEAGISACHCAAADYESTNWPQILSLYDQLLARNDSPIVALNRAVAVAQVHGPKAGLTAVKSINDTRALENYYLYYAVLGEFEEQLEQYEKAASHFRKALALTDLKSEQTLLAKRLQDCEGRLAEAAA